MDLLTSLIVSTISGIVLSQSGIAPRSGKFVDVPTIQQTLESDKQNDKSDPKQETSSDKQETIKEPIPEK